MKRAILLLMIAAVVGLGLSVFAIGPVRKPPIMKATYVAKLLGTEEVPPVTTKATGEANFRLNRAGDALEYQIRVRGLEKPTGAHLHLGALGANGDPIVMLYPAKGKTPPTPEGTPAVEPTPAPGTHRPGMPGMRHEPGKGMMKPSILPRVLARGSIGAADLVGPLAGKTLKDLEDKIQAGEVYVNVHTEAHAEGELRGQLTVRK